MGALVEQQELVREQSSTPITPSLAAPSPPPATNANANANANINATSTLYSSNNVSTSYGDGFPYNINVSISGSISGIKALISPTKTGIAGAAIAQSLLPPFTKNSNVAVLEESSNSKIDKQEGKGEQYGRYKEKDDKLVEVEEKEEQKTQEQELRDNDEEEEISQAIYDQEYPNPPFPDLQYIASN